MRLLANLFLVLVLAGTAAAEPARWTVTDEDTTLLVFGSVHVLKPGTDWLDSGLRSDLERADALILETVQTPRGQQETQVFLQGNGLLSGTTLEDRLGAARFYHVKKAFESVGVPDSQIQTMRPWLATISLIFGRFGQLGFSPALGVEATLQGIATAAGVDVRGLEGPLDGVRLLASLSPEQENALLMGTVEEMAEAETVIDTLTGAWLAGDIDGVADITNQSIDDLPALMEPLLFGRNGVWAERLDDLMVQPGLYVVVVGTAHLAGDGNLLELLAAKGYDVKRVISP